MAFIDKTDVLRYIDESTVDQITDNDDNLVVEAIKDAETRITEKIGARVDTASEFAKVDPNRDRSLLYHCINLTIYYLFNRLYTDVIPEGRVQAMEAAEKWLDDVYKGRINVTLDTIDEANEQGWSLRWGSDTKKGSQNY